MNQYKKTWPISVEKEIDASTEKIWNIISKEGNLNLVHPFCKNNYALAWASENSVDVLEYLNGLTFIREFKTWNPGEGYSLLIGTKKGKKSNLFEKNRRGASLGASPAVFFNFF